MEQGETMRLTIIIIMLILLAGVQGASALVSNITVNSDKTISIDEVKTFPMGMLLVCSYVWDDTTEPCETSLPKFNNFTFAIKAFGVAKPDDLVTYYTATIPKYEVTNVYFDVPGGSWDDTNRNLFNTSSRFFGYYQVPDEMLQANFTFLYNQYHSIASAGLNTTHPVIYTDWKNMTRAEQVADILVTDQYSYEYGDTDGWDLDEFLFIKEHKLFNDYFRTGSNTFNAFDNISKPVWFMFEGFGTNWNDGNDWRTFPNKNYLRAMTYWGITANGRGITYYGNKPPGNPTNGLWGNDTIRIWYNDFAGEIKSLNDILVLPNLNYSWGSYVTDNKVTFSNNPTKTIFSRERQYLTYALKNGTINNYIIVVNRYNQTVQTYINVTGLTGTHNWTTLGNETSGSSRAGRTLTSTNGNITTIETFDPYAAHIYEISSESAPPSGNATTWTIRGSGGDATWSDYWYEGKP